MNLAKAFRPKNGISLDDVVGIDYTANDPRTGSGEEAPIGSILVYTDGTSAKIFRKNGVTDTAWVEISSALVLQTSDPTSASDSTLGFSRFDQIINTSTNTLFICIDPTATSAVWQEVGAGGGSLPTGGTTGQALIKQSATDGDADWTDIDEVPTGGTTGQVLKKNSATDGDYDWADESGGGGSSNASSTKDYYRYYSTGVDLANWQNTECKLNDNSDEPSWYNSGYQVERSNFKGALILPHDTNTIHVSFLLGQIKNKSGGVIPSGSTCDMRIHIVLMSKTGVSNPHTIDISAVTPHLLNGGETSQRTSPILGNGSLSLPSTLPKGSMVGVSVTMTNSATFQAVNDLMVVVNYEE